jgi:hypothetical protein
MSLTCPTIAEPDRWYGFTWLHHILLLVFLDVRGLILELLLLLLLFHELLLLQIEHGVYEIYVAYWTLRYLEATPLSVIHGHHVIPWMRRPGSGQQPPRGETPAVPSLRASIAPMIRIHYNLMQL